jgi:hypothetical protein
MPHNTLSGENRDGKHGVVDTLDSSQHAVAVVEKPVNDTVRTNYYVGFDNGFAEVSPANNCAKHISRDALTDRIEALPGSATVTIKPDKQLHAGLQREIAQQLATLRNDTDC